MASLPVAVSVTLRAPDRAAPSSTEAVVMSSTMLMAAPAPTPTLLESLSLALALAVLLTADPAVRVRSPPLRLSPNEGAVVLTSALVSMSAMVSASEPATATLPPPAPAVDSVSSVSMPSPPPVVRMTALSVRPSAETWVPTPVVAALVILTRLMATAAPMLAVFALVPLPLALTVESASSEVFMAAAPDVLRLTPSATVASALAVMIAIAAAAATVTVVPPFSPLFAFGVLEEPESLPAALFDVLLPSASWLSALVLTSLPVSSVAVSLELDFSLLPAELALASVSLPEWPSAASVTSPPAVRLRLSWEAAMWLATRSAIEMPMPALPP